jgi:hypothetical protein
MTRSVSGSRPRVSSNGFIHVSSELAFILNSARLLPGSIAPGAGYTAAPLSSSPAVHVRS